MFVKSRSDWYSLD